MIDAYGAVAEQAPMDILELTQDRMTKKSTIKLISPVPCISHTVHLHINYHVPTHSTLPGRLLQTYCTLYVKLNILSSFQIYLSQFVFFADYTCLNFFKVVI